MDMKKRITAAVLWFLAGWALGAMVAFAIGAPSALAPVLAIGAAAFVARDPRQIIWARSGTPSPFTSPRT